MKCSCIKGDYNFALDYSDCSRLVYTDASLWMQSPDHFIPDTYQIVVTTPTGSPSQPLDVFTQAATTFKAGDLGLPSECIPDGLYEFSATTCGDTFFRTIGIMCSLRCCLNDFITKSTIQDLDTINTIEFYIKSAELHGAAGNSGEFQKFFGLLPAAPCNSADLI